MSSAIPPAWIAAGVQSVDAQARAAEAKNKEETAQTEATEDPNFKRSLTDAIANDDRDSSVYSDAEGAGGSGRAFSEEPSDDESPEPGKTDDSAAGLDVEA